MRIKAEFGSTKTANAVASISPRWKSPDRMATMNPPEASIHELWVKDVGLARTRDVACCVRGGRSSAARSGNNASAAQHLLALDGRSPRLNSRGSLAESRFGCPGFAK